MHEEENKKRIHRGRWSNFSPVQLKIFEVQRRGGATLAWIGDRPEVNLQDNKPTVTASVTIAHTAQK